MMNHSNVTMIGFSNHQAYDEKAKLLCELKVNEKTLRCYDKCIQQIPGYSGAQLVACQVWMQSFLVKYQVLRSKWIDNWPKDLKPYKKRSKTLILNQVTFQNIQEWKRRLFNAKEQLNIFENIIIQSNFSIKAQAIKIKFLVQSFYGKIFQLKHVALKRSYEYKEASIVELYLIKFFIKIKCIIRYEIRHFVQLIAYKNVDVIFTLQHINLNKRLEKHAVSCRSLRDILNYYNANFRLIQTIQGRILIFFYQKRYVIYILNNSAEIKQGHGNDNFQIKFKAILFKIINFLICFTRKAGLQRELITVYLNYQKEEIKRKFQTRDIECFNDWINPEYRHVYKEKCNYAQVIVQACQ